jgi:hypothetical protein
MTTDTPGRAAGIPGDEAVKKATGREWREWFAVLDADGADAHDHRGIVALAVRNGAGDWWAQMISVAYEQARGKRALHQKPDGYAVSASRTVRVPAIVAYEAVVDPEQRRAWLPEPVEVTTSTPGRSVRLRWADGSRVNVEFWPKGDVRTQVAIRHERLPTPEAAAAMKARWATAIDALRERLDL